MTTTLKLLALGLAAALPFAFTARDVAAQQPTVIRVANLELGTNVPVNYLAKIAPRFGLDVRIVNFRRGVETAQALKANEVDVALGGMEAAISGAAGGAAVVILSNYCSGGVVWTARPELNLKNLADVKGRRFGTIRGIHELMMLVEFDRAGLTWSEQPGKDVQLVFLNSGPALANALKTKQIDLMTNAEPLPSRSIVEGYGAQFYVPNDTPIGDVARALFMRRDFFEKNRDASQRFVEALVEGTKKLRDEPAFARDFAVNEALKGAITAEDWDLMFKTGHTAFDVALTIPKIQATADYMHKFGMIKDHVDVHSFTELAPLEAAMKKSGW